MLRKTLTLGMVFILAVSLLLVSMITSFTYNADAHDVEECRWELEWVCWWVGPFCVWVEVPVKKCKLIPHIHTVP